MKPSVRLLALSLPKFGNSLLIGIGAVAGLIGGFYLLTHGAKTVSGKIIDMRTKRIIDEEQLCNVCCTEVIDPKCSFVTCYICKKKICRGFKCADWIAESGQWECELCHASKASKASMAQTSSWVAAQMSFNERKLVYPVRARSEIYIPISDFQDSSIPEFESVSQIGGMAAAITAEDKIRIREYVEEVVSYMLGGSLDQIRVGQLSRSETYLPAIINSHNANNNNNSHSNNGSKIIANTSNNNNERNGVPDFTDIPQTRLRQLIEAIIAETLRCSTPGSISGAISEIEHDTRNNGSIVMGNGVKRRHRTEHYFEPKIYQDLLATAVLNKITEGETKFSKELSESTPDLSGRHIDENYNVEALSTSSGSSVEPRSDCSDMELLLNTGKSSSQQSLIAAVERVSVLSDYVAGHMVPLPDLTSSITESEDDFISMTSSAIEEGTWEDNWLFRKKRTTLQGSTTTSSMLVPAPKEHVSAQIGDRTADEVSDLSEMGSDTDESSSSDVLRTKLEPLNDRLLNKHLIGGHNTKLVLDELVDRTSMISNALSTADESNCTETKNAHVITNNNSTAPTVEAINAEMQKSNPAGGDENVLLLTPPKNFRDKMTQNEAQDISPIAASFSTPANETNEQLSSNDVESDNELIPYNKLKLHKSNSVPCTKTKPHLHTNTKLTNGVGPKPTQAPTEINGDHIEYHIESEDDLSLLRRFVPGSIAERECKKWYNAVEMPNNPYSAQALKRRISGHQERCMDVPNISPSTEQNPISLMAKAKDNEITANENNRETDYKRYSRDYYINDVNGQPTSLKSQPTIDMSQHSFEDEPGSDDIVINEAPNANKTANEQENSAEDIISNEHANSIYKALPALVVEESTSSIETLSNQSLQSINTTTSDDSDTVRIYDFKKQEMTVLRNGKPERPILENTSINNDGTTNTNAATTAAAAINSSAAMESALDDAHLPQTVSLNNSTSVGSNSAPATPTRGSTPPALKFLQPKRKLIDANLVRSFEDEPVQIVTAAAERPVIEKEIAQSLPSVKALAKAFSLNEINSSTQPPVRLTHQPKVTTPKKQLQMLRQIGTDCGDEATIASDLSSLETDPSAYMDIETKEHANEAMPTMTAPQAEITYADGDGKKSPLPIRAGFLKSNIAFFENLKTK